MEGVTENDRLHRKKEEGVHSHLRHDCVRRISVSQRRFSVCVCVSRPQAGRSSRSRPGCAGWPGSSSQQPADSAAAVRRPGGAEAWLSDNMTRPWACFPAAGPADVRRVLQLVLWGLI